MQPGQRVDVIKRVATQLAATDSWSEIDLVLDQFGFPTSVLWNQDMESYVIHHIKDENSDKLATIYQYLIGHASYSEEPWESDEFKLFLTHVASQKSMAHTLKSSLQFYGIDSFVAHEDIRPGKEWQLVIESALHSCHALAALLHDGFRQSDWCEQEVGFALGRGLVVVPIQFDLVPYGFFGSVQAINNIVSQEPKALARNVALALLRDKRTAERLIQTVVDQLAEADSFDQANKLSRMLANDAPLLSNDHVEHLRRAEKENSQLRNAFHFNRYLSSIEAKIDATHSVDDRFEDNEDPFGEPF